MEHRVQANPELARQTYTGNYIPRQDVQQWLNGNLGKRAVYSSKWGWKGKWSVSGRGSYAIFSFASRGDALLFKLTWGGR